MRRVVAAGLAAALLVAGGSLAPNSAAAAAPLAPEPAAVGLPVEGYLMAQPESAGYVVNNAAALTIVGVDGVNLTKSGAKLTGVPAPSAEIVATAHRLGLKAELLVSNYSDALGDFSTKAAGRLLTSKKHRAAVVKSLVAKVKKYHFDGVQIDLESLKRSHGPGLTAFVKLLRKKLPASKAISMAVMASASPGGYRSAGYQLTKLRSVVNRFVLMAYDQHGPTWSGPGPIGGTPWVRQVLTAFLAAGVPKARVDLGVGEYAYSWPANGADGQTLTLVQARQLAGDRARFDATQQEWTATLADGTVIWWSDATSFAARKALAAEFGVHGLAVWELSIGDPIS